jgi:processing peptidase subunit beta
MYSRILSAPHFKKSQCSPQGKFFSTSSGKVPNHLLNIPPTKVTVNKNGLRVASEESYGETATIGVFIDAGSVYEDEKTNGVAHFLEHMAFKGTQNRSKKQLEEEIENMGGSLNAYTSREQTVYYAKVFKNDVPKAMDILSDILLNSKYEKDYVEAERSTILREMEEVNKDYNEVIFDHLHSAAFQGTALGRTILGPEENVKSITRDNLVQYVKNNYTADRMVVVAAGAVDHNQVSSLADKYFGNVGRSTAVRPSVPTKFTGSQLLVRDDTVPKAHVALAVQGIPWHHPDYFVMMVLQTLVGSWDKTIGGGTNLSSRLCEILATEKLVDSVSTFNVCYADTGLFGSYLVAQPHHLDDAIFQVLNEYVRLGRGATESEVERAKTKLCSSLLMTLDGHTATMEDIGRQLLTHGRRLSPAEVALRIDAITVGDVQRVARQYCEDVDPVVAAVGPLEELPDYNNLRGWTYWNRL